MTLQTGSHYFGDKNIFFKSAKQKGFTLLEVIISLVILSVGLVSVQKVFLFTVARLSLVDGWIEAQNVVQKQIWEMDRALSEKGKWDQSLLGETDVIGRTKKFKMVLKTELVSDDKKLHRTDLRIAWLESRREHNLSRAFYWTEPYAAQS